MIYPVDLQGPMTKLTKAKQTVADGDLVSRDTPLYWHFATHQQGLVINTTMCGMPYEKDFARPGYTFAYVWCDDLRNVNAKNLQSLGCEDCKRLIKERLATRWTEMYRELLGGDGG